MSGVTDNERTAWPPDWWWHELHGLHDEKHHQAHDRLHLCVPLNNARPPSKPTGERPVGTGPTAAEHAEMVRNARSALDRWYSGTTDDPGEVVMYLENALAALVALADRTERERDEATRMFAASIWQTEHRNLHIGTAALESLPANVVLVRRDSHYGIAFSVAAGGAGDEG